MEAWIEKIRDGDEEVLMAYFRKYQPTVLSLRKRIRLKFFELDDWLQEGLMVFYKSVLHYEAQKEVTFGLYFKMNLERHFISQWRKEQALKRRGDLEALYFEDNESLANNNFFMDNDWNISDYANYVQVAEQARRFSGKLSAFEHKVHLLHGKNFSPKEIAASFHCNEKKIKSTLSRICRKLKQHLDEE
ncbi:sigma-70 family RNA polymerase sigma factor [Enterococcus nangangensis]